MNWWIWLILGLGLGTLTTWWAVRTFPKFNLLDFPERYDLTRDRLPYPGGLMLFIASLLLAVIDFSFLVLLLPLIVLGTLSFIDDRCRVSALKRLLVQIWLAAFVVLMGVQINFITNPFAATNFELAMHWPWLAFLVSVIWIVAIQNAINWFDGLPGLSVGVSGVGFLVLAVLGLIRPELWFDPNHLPLTHANFYLAGLCVGAWWFYWRGKIILGDTGSQVLGFLLAVMSIWSGAKIATTLMVLGLPMLDFVWVIFRRMVLQRKSPFSGDMAHMHHLLTQKVKKARMVSLWLILSSLCLGFAALLFAPMVKLWLLLIFGVLVIALNFWLWETQRRH